MNNPNPLIPQGSLLEQKAKGRPHLRVAYVIVAIHLVFLGGLLIQGCKKEDATAKNSQQTNDSTLPPLDQSNLYQTNAAGQSTNPSLQDLTQTSFPSGTNPGSPLPGPSQSPLELPGAAREYIVVRGDNFTTIGRKFGVPWSAIARANPGVNSTQLKVGQKLVIPAPASPSIAAATAGNDGENAYVVKSGDNLSKIAIAHGTTVRDIKALNGLKTDQIKAGDKLKLPAAKAAPATVPATSPGTPPAPPPGGAGNL